MTDSPAAGRGGREAARAAASAGVGARGPGGQQVGGCVGCGCSVGGSVGGGREAANAAGDGPSGRRFGCERERRRVGPEVGPTAALSSCIPTGMHGAICIVWANLTPFSLHLVRTPMRGRRGRCRGRRCTGRRCRGRGRAGARGGGAAGRSGTSGALHYGVSSSCKRVLTNLVICFGTAGGPAAGHRGPQAPGGRETSRGSRRAQQGGP
jgi:hypothetical protein